MKTKIKFTVLTAALSALMITFFFIPLGGSTGYHAAVHDGSILPILGMLAGTSGLVAMIILTVRSWRR